MASILRARYNEVVAPDLVFTVDVDFTDRTRTAGRFTTFTHHTTVLADTDHDATLVAAQMVASVIGDDDMIIATRITGVAA